jgi:hypothetical protein
MSFFLPEHVAEYVFLRTLIIYLAVIFPFRQRGQKKELEFLRKGRSLSY